MRIEIIDRKPTFVGLSLALTRTDIEQWMRLLSALAADGAQYFHASTIGGESGTFIDIEVSVQAESEGSNAFASGFAIDPSESV